MFHGRWPTSTVVTILSDPDVQGFMRQGLMYWWDPLNAAAAVTGRLVTYKPVRLSVVQSGLEAGRTVEDPRGARIRRGGAADAPAVGNPIRDLLSRKPGARTGGERIRISCTPRATSGAWQDCWPTLR